MPVLLRIAAIAGFAFAGWFALSALSDSAYAAEQPSHAAPAEGPGALRHLTSAPGLRTVTEGVREVGDDPVRYVRSRQHDLLADKQLPTGKHLLAGKHLLTDRGLLAGEDRVIGQVRELAGDTGVPHVRIPDLGPERPVIGDLVHPVNDARPGQETAAPERLEEQHEAGATGKAESKDKASGARHTAVAPVSVADQKAGDCTRCGGDDRAPAHGPVPPGQDAPKGGGGSAGGHQIVPVADLPSRRSPAAPTAVDASTFRRTALTDVAAPGGPSVVPD
ncbi:hypothetical protein [Actinomadura chokoriensis]|uniref:Secreted protein n=1 Tax=Actinomadura chokoriensis TaxID=454156 RepID=A0ABV4QYR5_9ACTN